MKKLLTLSVFALFGTFSNAQDCSKYIKSTTNKISGKVITSGIKGIYFSNGEGKEFHLVTSTGETGSIILGFYTDNLNGCVDKGNKINFLFTDNTRMEVGNMRDFNCEGESAIYFNKTRNNLDKLNHLQSKTISSIIFNGENDFIKAKLTVEQQQDLKNILTCLAKK